MEPEDYKGDEYRGARCSPGPLYSETRARRGILERETGFEPATSTLARLHSTTELFPPIRASLGREPQMSIAHITNPQDPVKTGRSGEPAGSPSSLRREGVRHVLHFYLAVRRESDGEQVKTTGTIPGALGL